MSHDWVPAEGPLTIGRGTGADLRIPRDVLSREHARLELSGREVLLTDLDSRNGVKVNGERVWRPVKLSHGDRVSVGDVVLSIDLSRWETTPGASPPGPEDPTVGLAEPAAPGGVGSIDQTIAAGDRSTVDLTDTSTVQRRVIELDRPRIVLGRDEQCEEVLDSLLISRLNTEVRRSDGRLIVRDLNSTNGTVINGVAITRRTELRVGDRLSIGPFHFDFDGRSLTSGPTQRGMEIRVQGLGRVVRNRQTGRPLHLLDDVSFTIPPNSFVGLLGPSGCGKSTLMDALNGRRRGTDGRVLFNDADLYREFDAFKSGIGYVPQEVIFHDTLPLGEALRYGSRLRLSADVSAAEINRNIDRVLEVVGLADRRGTVIRDLSGGQKKRVSIAIELLSNPDVLFLDEVTSGLDLGTEKEMMELFRKLADDGKTIICITHFLESLKECDKLICLMRGKLVFDGDPADMKRHFEIEELREIYGLEKKAEPAQWREKFLGTDEGRRLDREARVGGDDGGAPAPKAGGDSGLDFAEFLLQLRVLTLRYVRLLTLDRKMLFLLIALAPLIGGMLCVYAQSIDVPDVLAAPASFAEPDQAIDPAATRDPARLSAEVQRIVDDTADYEQRLADMSKDYRLYYGQQRMLLFGSVLAAMFLSMFAAVQEIVKELPIYFHERFVKLQLFPYLLSKLLPLGVLGAVQTGLLLGTIHLLADFDAGTMLWQFPVVFLVSMVGTVMGLAISAGVPGSKDSANIAVLLMIAVVIPQILFSGGLATLDGPAEQIGRWGVACYWGMEALSSLIGQAPPDGEAYPAFDGLDEMVGDAYALSLLVLAGHVAVLGVLLTVFMVKKDGPEAIRRVRTGLKQMAETAGLG
ncbi:MAG: FHA domain-containing protein [Planctomycetota bacterium]